jgi:hypothetical protein
LSPRLFVHALYDQPKAERRFPNKGREKNDREDPIFESGSQKQRDAVRQIAQTGHLKQSAEDPGQETRLKNQVPVHQEATPEEQ